MKTKQASILKRGAAFIEDNTETALIAFGVLAVSVAFLCPIRLDIQLLLGGFGFYLVIAGVIAKLISVKR